MMFQSARTALFGAALLAAASAPSLAADLIEPPVVVAPPVYEDVSFGGWYIRGDIDYHWSQFKGADYITYGCTECGEPDPGTNQLDGKLGGAWSLGGGVGYQATKYLRVDATADWWFKSKFRGETFGECGGEPCSSVDETSFSALMLLANVYADLGTYHGVTPYVGAGIGGAHVQWDDLRNTIGEDTTVHGGTKNWRFAYALMAGASYCLTSNVMADVGYRFSHIQGGRMFELNGAGPGFDNGIDTHEVRAGLRYQFGGKSNCQQPEPMVAYDVPAEPVYK